MTLAARRRIGSTPALEDVLHGLIAFMAREVLAIALSSFSNRKFLMFMAKSDKEDLALIRDLMADGKVKPVIDRRFRLSQVPDAVRYAEEGHARGKVVITLEPKQAISGNCSRDLSITVVNR